MYYGATFGDAGSGDFDTLDKYGLAVMANISIGAAELKSNYLDIPAMQGSVNLSTRLSFEPMFKRREIKFGLVAVRNPYTDEDGAVDAVTFAQIVREFTNEVNGKELPVYLPDDPTSYWTGTVMVGGKSGYNTATIQVTLYAEPYRTLEDGTPSL